MKKILTYILIMICAKSYSANIESFVCYPQNDISIFIKLSEDKCEVRIYKDLTLEIILVFTSVYNFENTNDSIIILSDNCRSWQLLKLPDGNCKVTKGPDYLNGRIFNRHPNNNSHFLDDRTIKNVDSVFTEIAPIMCKPTAKKLSEGCYKLYYDDKLILKIISDDEYCLLIDNMAFISGRYEQKGQVIIFFNEDEKQEFFAVIESDSITFKMVPGIEYTDITIPLTVFKWHVAEDNID